MPRCEIDVDACPNFLFLVRGLRRRYRKIGRDLAEVFEAIEPDYQSAAGAAAIPGWEGVVWKHRCGSSDMDSGLVDGFRIISVVARDRASHVLYPVLIYAEPESQEVTPSEIAEAVRALERQLSVIDGDGRIDPSDHAGAPRDRK